MNRLVVVPATRGITDYFKPDELPMYEQDNVDELAERILWVQEQPEAAKAMLERGRSVYLQHLWPEEETRFLELVAAAVTAS